MAEFVQHVRDLVEVDDVEKRMDVLGNAVRSIDPTAYELTWGRNESPKIVGLTEDPLIPKRRGGAASRSV